MGGGQSCVACLCADHGSTLGDPAEGLSQVPAATHKWDLVVVLVDVVQVISRGEHLQRSIASNSLHAAITEEMA